MYNRAICFFQHIEDIELPMDEVKIIIISGAHSNSGKTTAGRAVQDGLDNAVLVKMGTGKPKSDSDIPLYPREAELDAIKADFPEAPCLIIESNSVLDRIEPDLLIYLPGDGEAKPSAAAAEERADLVYGGKIACPKAKQLARNLDLTPAQFCRIMDAVDVRLKMCEFGVF
jgi:hypothetical protein